MSYDEWKDLQRDERNEHLEKFLRAVDSTSYRVSRTYANLKTFENTEILRENPGETSVS